MRVHLDPAKASVIRQSLGVCKRINRLRNVVVHQLTRLIGRSVAQNKNRTVDSCLAELQSLCQIRHRKSVRARFLHLLSGVGITVTVAIRFYNGTKPRSGTQHAFYLFNIVVKGIEIYLRPCSS